MATVRHNYANNVANSAAKNWYNSESPNKSAYCRRLCDDYAQKSLEVSLWIIDNDMRQREYVYDVAKIEVLDEMTPNTSNGVGNFMPLAIVV